MSSIRILLIYIFSFVAFFQMNAQGFGLKKVEWADLHISLKLCHPVRPCYAII